MAEKEVTATNHETGERFVLREGQWVPLEPQLAATPYKYAAQDPASQPRINQGMRTGIGTVLANVLSTPHAAGELLAAGAALPALVPGGESFSDARAKQEKLQPAAALLALPDPSAEDVLAIPSSIKKSLSDPMFHRRRLLGTRFNEAVAEEQAKEDASPIASDAGRTAGDVGSMLALRPGRRAVDALKLGRFDPRAEIENTKGALDYAARALARGTGRAVEAGFDGAVMGALSDADPAKTAAFSAGAQAIGSVALTAKNSFFRNPKTTLVNLIIGHEIWKAIAPGPQDVLESKDTAIRELIAAYGTGAVAAMTGANRGFGAGNMRRFSDSLALASRATVASVVTQLQEAAANKQPQYARVLEMVSQDQERFGTDVAMRLERAASSDKPRALLNEIDQLMQSARFRKALEEPGTTDGEQQSRPSFSDYLLRR